MLASEKTKFMEDCRFMKILKINEESKTFKQLLNSFTDLWIWGFSMTSLSFLLRVMDQSSFCICFLYNIYLKNIRLLIKSKSFVFLGLMRIFYLNPQPTCNSNLLKWFQAMLDKFQRLCLLFGNEMFVRSILRCSRNMQDVL